MPYYRITITDIYGHVSQGIREDAISDIDAYYGKAYWRAIAALKGTLKSVDVVMLTSNCEEVKKQLEIIRNRPVSNQGAKVEFTGKQKFDAYNQDKNK